MRSEDRSIQQIKAEHETKIFNLKKLIRIRRDFICESLIKHANTALYQAKGQGRNRVVLAR